MISKSTGEQYSYDIQGNLISITGNGIDKEYTYNGNGNRLSESTDGETLYYVNDVIRAYEQVLQTYDESGNVVNTYTYGLQRISSTGEVNETYLYDGRGSVVGTVDNSNQFISYSYTAYGELMPDSPTPNVFGYNGEATDFVNGIQYLRARYYDVTICRFVQEDDYGGSFTEPQTMNRFAYVHSNPVMGIDPSGFDTDEFYIEVKGKKYFSYNELSQAKDNAEFNLSIYHNRYMHAYEKLYGGNGQVGTYNEYLDAFYEYKDAWDNAWFKTSKRISDLNDIQSEKYQIYKEDYAALTKATEEREPYLVDYNDLKTALESWNEKQAEYNEGILAQQEKTEEDRKDADEILEAYRNRPPELNDMTFSEFWWMENEAYMISPIPEGYEYTHSGDDAFEYKRSNQKDKNGNYTRVHAGIDYTVPEAGVPVVAMESGKVIKIKDDFYAETEAVIIVGKTGCTILYGEIASSVVEGSWVNQGDVIGHVKTANNDDKTTMLHLEIYSGALNGDPVLYNYGPNGFKYVKDNNYERRKDLLDPTRALGLPRIKLPQ